MDLETALKLQFTNGIENMWIARMVIIIIIIIIIISYLYRLNLFSNSVLLSIKDLFKTYINYKRK